MSRHVVTLNIVRGCIVHWSFWFKTSGGHPYKKSFFFCFFEVEKDQLCTCSDLGFHSVYIIIRLSSSLITGVSIGTSICAGVV